MLRLLVAPVLALTLATAAAGEQRALDVPLLPAHGVAIGTKHATIFLDLQGHKLARVDRPFALTRVRGRLVLYAGEHDLYVLRPLQGEIVRLARPLRLVAPAYVKARGCRAVAVRAGDWYRSCPRGIEVVHADGTARLVTGPPPRAGSRAPSAHSWVEVEPSPDGRTLLANASRECDGRHAYFVDVRSGTIRSVVSGDESFGIGWTPAGEGLLWLARGDFSCSGKRLDPGVYAFALSGTHRALVTGSLQGAAPWGS